MLVVFALAFGLGLLYLYWLSHRVSPEYWPIGVDVYPRWVGTRAFWQHQSPYAPAVELETQELIYGRSAHPGEDNFGFFYPAYAAVILAPLAFLPIDVAAVLWSAFMGAIFVTLVVTITLSVRHRLRPIPWAFLVLSILLYRPALLSVFNGQYGLFVIGCWGLAWWMMQRERLLLAGGLLALSTIKPSLGLLPTILVLLWSLLRGRSRVVLGFSYALGALLLLSFAEIGWWIPDFIHNLGGYSRIPRAWSSGDVFSIPGSLWLLLSAILVGVGVYANTVRGKVPYRLFFGGIFLNLLFTPHTLEYDLVVLLLPLLFLVPVLSTSVWGYGVLLVVICAPWITWLAFTLAGIPLQTWWRAIWQFYPALVATTLLVTARQDEVFDHAPPVFSCTTTREEEKA